MPVRERRVDGREQAQVVRDTPPDGVVKERDGCDSGKGALFRDDQRSLHE